MDILKEIFGSEMPDKANDKSVYFTDIDPEGYFSKKEQLEIARSLKGTWKLGHLKSTYENMNLQKKLMAPPSKDFDNGQPIIWLRFGYGNLRQNLQIPNVGRMYDFVMDYANGRLQHVKTLEELLIEAAEAEK